MAWLADLTTKNFWLGVLPEVLGAVIVVVLFTVFYFLVARLLLRGLERTALVPALQKILVRTIFKGVVVVFAIITLLNQIGIDVTAAIAGVGIVGIAVGLAAKESLANILSGFSIFIDALYAEGDWVEIVGKYGQVKQITLRTTKIRTLDNIFIIIPNAEITQNPVTNFSEEGMVRITAKVGIAYRESIDRAREVLLNAVSKIDGVLTEPRPAVVVDSLGDSSVNLLVRVWVDDAGTDQQYRFLLTETCKKALDEACIEIPFPQRVIHKA